MQEFRVIIEINDEIDEDDVRRTGLQKRVRFRDNRSSNLQVLNNRTLLFKDLDSKNVRHFRFDHVGYNSDSSKDNNIDEIMDQLLLERQPCCLMNIRQFRKCQIEFLVNTLIYALTKKLKLFHLELNSIKLDSYIDVRKNDLVNLLSSEKKHRHKSGSQTKFTFKNLGELKSWLEYGYLKLWSICKEHECFDFSFTVSDVKGTKCNAQLSLVNFYLDLMDSNTQFILGAILENHKREMNSTTLTDFIKDYFNSTFPVWSVYMIFNIPAIPDNTALCENILRLASAAYFGMYALKSKALDSASLTSQYAFLVSSSTNIKKQESEVVPEKSVMISNEKTAVDVLRDRIDEKFNIVMDIMQKYYEHKFSSQIEELCYEIKNLVYEKSTKSDTMIQRKEKIREERQQIAEEYHESLIAFREVELKVSQSQYEAILRDYLEEKKYELRTYALQHKVKHLAKCESSVKDTIDAEIFMLSSAFEANEQEHKIII
ncbi:uncharacterized protein LOC119685573 [Teleopsis dalmanni]|uniref:uncharacterized protein LOC119685573 n=1 Tax=Teleopsis dalmanni TaxID=139649 RepID=UPI0018CF762E|nr:uncharacterized protein LOC119685573 [Teleopsis dalmanni]